MENMSFVPGTVGATPVQNVGCYGTAVADIIDWVEVLDTRTDALHILSVPDCKFGYRDSVFKHAEGAHYIVTRVAYRLATHATPKLEYKDLQEHFAGRTDVTVHEVREALREIRGKKFPDITKVGTAGSFFMNPVVSLTELKELKGWLGGDVPSYPVDDDHVKVPAAWLLDKFGFKGKRVGAVGCWEGQPLVLVHYGGGTASELILFAYDIVKEVKRRTSLKLATEVCVVGGHHADAE
jgi:UDP-N-acetylmuramate dehydrogenase